MKINTFFLSFPVNFKLSRFRIIYSHHVVVQLSDGQYTGIGSGVLYRSTLWQLYQLWHTHASAITNALSAGPPPDNTSNLLAPIIVAEPGLAFALDTAVYDLKGKHEGQPVAELLGGFQRTAVPITEQIFIDDWAKSEQELQQIIARGTTHLKIKTGFSPEKDLALIQKVRRTVGQNVDLRIDANRAYNLTESLELYKQFKQLGVTTLEEPINNPDWASWRTLRHEVGLPIMLDESILSPADLQAAIQAKVIDSLNIKLTRVGGITQALIYAQLCHDAGVAVSIGCNEDIGPGMAAILHFSAAQTRHDGTEGVGHLRLGTDIIDEEMAIRDGALSLSTRPGLGVTLKPNFSRKLPSNVQVIDLNHVPAAQMRLISSYRRNKQRAATAVYRLQRKLLPK